MTIELAARLLSALLGFSLILQTLEFLSIEFSVDARRIWCWSVQKDDLNHTWQWLQRLLALVYSSRAHKFHLMIRLGCATSLFWGSTPVISVLLFTSNVLLLIRWRGSFNGGSDFMTVIVLTGIVIADLLTPVAGEVLAWRAALWYVTLQAMTSYFVSGAVKLLNADWRSGRALTYFLDSSVYGPLPQHSVFRHPTVALACTWSFILWEISFPLSLSGIMPALVFCSIALVFHLLVFRFFSLNRFVWAWSASFPAIIYCASQS